LCAILAEWSTSRSYTPRVANIKGTGTGPRANGNYFLKAAGSDATVFDDGAADVLTGSSGRDWFFANRSGGVLDVLTDRANNQLLEELP
jgi:Ca2+-binding RTX toxin-like protein